MKIILENSIVIRATEQAFSSLSSMLFIYACSRIMTPDIFSEFSYHLILYIIIGIVVNNAIVYPLQSKRNLSLDEIEPVLAIVIFFLLLIAIVVSLFSNHLSASAFFYSAMLAGLNAVRIIWFVHGNYKRQWVVLIVHIIAITASGFSLLYAEELFLAFVSIIYFIFLTLFFLNFGFSREGCKNLFSVLTGGKFMVLAGLMEWYGANQILIWITSKQNMTLIAGEFRISQLYYGMVIVSLVFFDSLFSKLLLLDEVKKAKKYLGLGLIFIFANTLTIFLGHSELQRILSLKIDKNILLLLFPYYFFSILYLFFKVRLRVREQYKSLFFLQIASIVLVQGLLVLNIIPIIDYVFYYCIVVLNMFMTISHGLVSWKSRF